MQCLELETAIAEADAEYLVTGERFADLTDAAPIPPPTVSPAIQSPRDQERNPVARRTRGHSWNPRESGCGSAAP